MPLLAYDSARRRTVMFGGYFGIAQQETWEWDGTDWVNRTPATTPPLNGGSKMAYDAARGRTVLLTATGGQQMATWEWDGTDWTEIKHAARIPWLDGPGLAYDTARQRTILFGGRTWAGGTYSYANNTWEWNGRDWQQLTLTTQPSPRAFSGLAYDSVRQRVVLHGGSQSFFGTTSDTWEFGLPSLTLSTNTATLPISTGGTQTLQLRAGADLKNQAYWVFGSATSTTPGIVVSGIHLPLAIDVYTGVAIQAVNTPVFAGFAGVLSATGTATASLVVPAGLPIPPGSRLYHSYLVIDGKTGRLVTSSNPVSVEFR